MPSQEENRETGRAFVVGAGSWYCSPCLWCFFHPAAIRLGQIRFGVIAGAMVVVGLLLSFYA
jgi:hypothetical protein